MRKFTGFLATGLILATSTGAFAQGGSTARNDGTTRIAQLELGWNLFDFGQREANVESARQTLLAAVASQDLGVQTVFLDAANAYFALLAAQGELAVAREVERINLQSFMAAEAKHAAGVGDLTSKLQTQTAFAQAILARVRAEGAVRNAQGKLAVSVGESPERPLTVDADDARLSGAADETAADGGVTLAVEAEAVDDRLVLRQAEGAGLRVAGLSFWRDRADLGEAEAQTQQRVGNLGALVEARRHADGIGKRQPEGFDGEARVVGAGGEDGQIAQGGDGGAMGRLWIERQQQGLGDRAQQ